jgi:hypothetical protein
VAVRDHAAAGGPVLRAAGPGRAVRPGARGDAGALAAGLEIRHDEFTVDILENQIAGIGKLARRIMAR